MEENCSPLNIIAQIWLEAYHFIRDYEQIGTYLTEVNLEVKDRNRLRPI